MRISTNSVFNGATSRLMEQQSKLDKISMQVSSGRKMISPSDDPVASAQVLEVQQSSAINTQYAKNRLSLQNTLGIVDGTLSTITESLQSINEQVISAGNGVLSSDQLSYIGSALEGQYNQLLALANSTDGAGHYLFSGQNTDTKPFAVSNGVVSYQGAQEQVSVKVDTFRSMDISINGESLFPNNADFFNKLKSTIDVLKSGSASASSRQTSLAELATSLNSSMNQVNNSHASVGTRMQEIDSLNSLGSDKDLSYGQTLSSLKDLDYNKALSDLARQQMILQAAQKTFSQTNNLSLFNFIG
jgi:flagellar hook-associated protein 3 FlgL